MYPPHFGLFFATFIENYLKKYFKGEIKMKTIKSKIFLTFLFLLLNLNTNFAQTCLFPDWTSIQNCLDECTLTFIEDYCLPPCAINPGGCNNFPECFDGQDNDGDGLTDYPNDPGCSSLTDTDETDFGKDYI